MNNISKNNTRKNWSDAELRRRLLTIAQAVLGSREAAEDIVQDACLRLFEREETQLDAQETTRVASPSAWLSTVTRNLAIDQLRREQREREVLRLEAAAQLSVEWDGILTSEESLTAIVTQLLRDSDPDDTAIVLLHTVFGVPYRDIANVSGRRETTLRQAAHRCVKKAARSIEYDCAYLREPENTTVYVQAIFDADPNPLFDRLRICASVGITACNAGITVPRTRHAQHALVMTPGGVRLALTLDGILLCVTTEATHNDQREFASG